MDPITREIRLIRAKRYKEIRRNPERASENCTRRVMAMASNVVYHAPNMFTATYRAAHDATEAADSAEEDHSADSMTRRR